MTLEDQLAAGMHERVTGLSLEPGVLARATRSHRRRVATARLGLVGLAGVLAAGLALTTLPRTSPAPTQARPPAEAQAPAVVLANAAAASDDISYRFRLTTDSLVYEGAFDPRTDTGYLRCDNDAGTMVELLIAGTRYIGTETRPGVQVTGTHEAYGRYGQYPGKHDRLSFGLDDGAAANAASADPAELFKALRAAGATVVQNADGTMRFTSSTDDGTSKSTQNGDVTVGADGRIARVAIKGTWSSTAKGRLDQGTFSQTLELYDYGLTVTAQRPADVVPA